VVRAGRREADDQAHRPARIGVRERTASNGGRGDSGRRQLEKLAAETVHDNAPGPCTRIDAKQQSDTTFAKSAVGGNANPISSAAISCIDGDTESRSACLRTWELQCDGESSSRC